MKTSPFFSERITIRSQQYEDRAFITELFFDPIVNKYLSDPAVEYADDRYLKAIAAMPDEESGYYFVIELSDTRTPIGACCAFPHEDGAVDIGYTLLPAYHRRHFGTEALTALIGFIKTLGAKAVTCEIADENEASKALVKKLGFRPARASEFKKYNMDVVYPSHIYKLDIQSE